MLTFTSVQVLVVKYEGFSLFQSKALWVFTQRPQTQPGKYSRVQVQSWSRTLDRSDNITSCKWGLEGPFLDLGKHSLSPWRSQGRSGKCHVWWNVTALLWGALSPDKYTPANTPVCDAAFRCRREDDLFPWRIRNYECVVFRCLLLGFMMSGGAFYFL